MSSLGNLVESAVLEVVSRRAEGDVEFGRVLEFGADPAVQAKHYAGGARIVGIAVYDPTKGHGPSRGTVERKYTNAEMMGVLRKGVIRTIAGPTSGTIIAGTRLTVLRTATVFPTLVVTAADLAVGINPAWGATARVAYTILGEWGQSALIGASATINCPAIGNHIRLTVPGLVVMPAGTTHIQLYVSMDNGATWANWPAGNIALTSLTVGATHTIDATDANQALGTTPPPAENPAMPTVGAILKAMDTRDVLAIAGSEIIKGGTAGQEVWVQLNLPA